MPLVWIGLAALVAGTLLVVAARRRAARRPPSSARRLASPGPAGRYADYSAGPRPRTSAGPCVFRGACLLASPAATDGEEVDITCLLASTREDLALLPANTIFSEWRANRIPSTTRTRGT